MPSYRRNEAARLVANFFNACAASILTVGVFTPCAVIVYGAAEIRSGWALPYLAIVCLVVSLGMHLLGQAALRLMEDVSS